MAAFSVKNVAIKGIAACVPDMVSENKSLTIFGKEGAEAFIKSTGYRKTSYCFG